MVTMLGGLVLKSLAITCRLSQLQSRKCTVARVDILKPL